MFNIGDLIIYSAQGICSIDNIEEKTFFGDTKEYYILHPVENPKLQISIPVDNDKVVMLEMLNKEKAEEILESFKGPGIEWIEVDSHRYEVYSDFVKKGNRKEIAKIGNTLIRQRIKIEAEGKKFHEKDKKVLATIEGVLFAELAYSLKATPEAISRKVNELINENQY